MGMKAEFEEDDSQVTEECLKEMMATVYNLIHYH